MSQAQTNILLIDDSDVTNVIHRRIIKKANAEANVIVATNGELGLEAVRTLISETGNLPDLIFLDINMPVMNGWDFLDEFEKLPEYSSDDNQNVVVMLTTSMYEGDVQKAETYSSIRKYIQKPLNGENLLPILESL